MKKITTLLFSLFLVLNFTFAGINPTTAWWNNETFEGFAPPADLKAGWVNIYGAPNVVAQTVSTAASGESGVVHGISFNGLTTFGESSQGGGRGVYKSFDNALGGLVYIKTNFYHCTNGSTYTLKNTSGATVFEFGGYNNNSGQALWITGKTNAEVALASRAKWSHIECVLDLINNKVVKVNLSYNGTTKTFTDITLPAGTDIKRLDVNMSKGYEAAGFDNTTFASLVADNIKNLTGDNSLQTLSGSTVERDYSVTSFTTAMELDHNISQTDMDITWSVSNWGTLSTADQSLVSLTRSATDNQVARLSVGNISADATITLQAVYGATTLTKDVLLQAASVAGLKELLLAEISTATTKKNSVVDSNPYIATAKSTLQAQIDVAQTVYDNADATEGQVNTAKTDLQTAETAFQSDMQPYDDFVSYIATVQSTHDAEVRVAPFFTAVKGTLSSAISDANGAKLTVSLLSDINTAKSTLETALGVYNTDHPAYDNLSAQIATVDSRLAIVNPRAGSTFLRFATDNVNNLTSSRNDAQSILGTATTAVALNTEKTDLESDLTAFNAMPRVAPSTTDYYRIYTYGVDNGDGGVNKLVVYADESNVLRYTDEGNTTSSTKKYWKIDVTETGKYLLQVKSTGEYLNGFNTLATETPLEFTLPEGSSQYGSISVDDGYFLYNIVTPGNKGLEVDLYNAETSNGVFITSNAPATRFRFLFQFEPVSMTTALEDAEKSDMRIFSENSKIIVEGVAEKTSYTLYNLSGCMLNSGISSSQRLEFNVSDKGMYIIKIGENIFKILN